MTYFAREVSHHSLGCQGPPSARAVAVRRRPARGSPAGAALRGQRRRGGGGSPTPAFSAPRPEDVRCAAQTSGPPRTVGGKVPSVAEKSAHERPRGSATTSKPLP